MNKVLSASAIHFPGRRKIGKGRRGGRELWRGEGKPKFLLQMLPTSTRRAPGRVLRGQGGQLPERLSPLPSPFSPRALRRALLAGDCGEDASSSSQLLPGPGRRRGRDVAGGLRAALAPGSGGGGYWVARAGSMPEAAVGPRRAAGSSARTPARAPRPPPPPLGGGAALTNSKDAGDSRGDGASGGGSGPFFTALG